MNSPVTRLDVEAPLENRHVLVEVYLVHTAERPQEVPQPRPDPFQRVVVHLADPVAIVVPRPLPRGWQTVAWRRPIADSPFTPPLIRVHRRRRLGAAGPRAPTSAVGVLAVRSRTWPLSRPTTPQIGGRSLSQLPWPRALLARRRGGSSGRCAARLFSPRSGTSCRPPPPGRPAALVAYRQAAPGADAAGSATGAVAVRPRGPVGRWARPGRSPGGSGSAAAVGRPWRAVPVKALKTRWDWPTDNRGRAAVAAMHAQPIALGQRGQARPWGWSHSSNWLAGLLVHQFDDGEVHGRLLGPGDTVGHP